MLVSLQEIDAHCDLSLTANLRVRGRTKAPFPEWQESTTGMPNWMIRSSLFGTFAKGKGEKVENHVLASFKNMTIRYTGRQLDQGDLSVWLMILQFSYRSDIALGRPIRFKDSDLLKALGKTCGGAMRDMLVERIDRLSDHKIILEQGRQVYRGSLISNLWRNNDTAEHIVAIDRNLAVFYSEDQLSWINWKIRLELEEHPLAQWLHCYYSSHKDPYENRLESLLRWSGSKCKYFVSETPEKHRDSLRSACQTLRKALNQLKRASELHGAIFTWKEEGQRIAAKLTFDSAVESYPMNRKALNA